MNESQFKALYECTFNPDPIHEAICDRLRDYYNASSDHVDNAAAAKNYKRFSAWCSQNGFTPMQISAAKKDARFRDIK